MKDKGCNTQIWSMSRNESDEDKKFTGTQRSGTIFYDEPIKVLDWSKKQSDLSK